MNKRSAFKIFVLALFVSMIIIFFKFAESKDREKFDTADTTGCNEESPCVRICTENRNEVVMNETSINFELTNPLTNITSIFSVLNGRPCEKMKILEAQWKFSSVSLQECECNIFPRLTFWLFAERIYFCERIVFLGERILSRNRRRKCKWLWASMERIGLRWQRCETLP